MGALISYLFLALFVSFICSLTESVLLSTPQTYLTTMVAFEHLLRDKAPFEGETSRKYFQVLPAVSSPFVVCPIKHIKGWARSYVKVF